MASFSVTLPATPPRLAIVLPLAGRSASPVSARSSAPVTMLPETCCAAEPASVRALVMSRLPVLSIPGAARVALPPVSGPFSVSVAPSSSAKLPGPAEKLPRLAIVLAVPVSSTSPPVLPPARLGALMTAPVASRYRPWWRVAAAAW